jgi:hypothetical protein
VSPLPDEHSGGCPDDQSATAEIRQDDEQVDHGWCFPGAV